MSLPSLSVVVPNYNHAKYLPRSLQALVAQSVQALEIIVIDDGSTDNSVEVIQEFATRFPTIRLFRNGKNQGVLFSVNRGLDLARGEYVFFTAADDEVVPGFFEKSLRLLAQHPQAALSATISDYREAHTGLSWHWGVGIADAPTYLSPECMVAIGEHRTLYIPPNSVIFKKTALLEVGKFIPELKFCCDWYATYLAAFRHGFCFVPEPLAIFHVRPNSYYHRTRNDKVEYPKGLAQLLQRLNCPENQDVVELIRKSGSLFLFAMPMLKLMLSQPQYRHFITPTFLRKNLAHSIKLLLKKIAPACLVKTYVKFSNYNAKRFNSQ